MPVLGLAAIGANAQLVISDTLTGGTSSYDWQSLAGACLTAGSKLTDTPIPKCVGLPYYSGKTLVGGVAGLLVAAAGWASLGCFFSSGRVSPLRKDVTPWITRLASSAPFFSGSDAVAF